MSGGSDLRRQVLKASLELIGQGGLDRLSMREVARKAGVSHQAPYHHFADREAILAALADEGFAKLKEDMDRAAAKAPAKSIAAIEAMGRAYVDFALRHPAHFQVMFRGDAVALDNYPEVRKREEAAFASLVRLIDEVLVAEPAEVRRQIAMACWGLTHGLAMLVLQGSLARKVGVSKTQQGKLANEAISAFGAMLERSRWA